MNHSTIELSPVPEDKDPEVRHAFRVPVHEKFAVQAVISSVFHPVSDISPEGIGILLKDNQAFHINETLASCQLHFNDIRLTDLTGKVIHCSGRGNDLWQFGIQWVNLKNSQKKELESLFFRLKKQVLGSTHTPVPENADEEK
ncbi:MAG: PilZ domain-containing protein [Desulfotignum sp.]|nr:PilZ domain-containing protein [Desulfotignum sp.]